jgi:hypothetical protein
VTVLFYLQLAAVAVVAVYLGCSGFLAHRRNTRSWDSLVARLGNGKVANIFVASPSEGIKAGAIEEEFRSKIASRRGLWAVFKGAGVVLQMADYAERSRSPIDPALLNSVRNDAMRSRVSALKALVFCA